MLMDFMLTLLITGLHLCSSSNGGGFTAAFTDGFGLTKGGGQNTIFMFGYQHYSLFEKKADTNLFLKEE